MQSRICGFRPKRAWIVRQEIMPCEAPPGIGHSACFWDIWTRKQNGLMPATKFLTAISASLDILSRCHSDQTLEMPIQMALIVKADQNGHLNSA